MKAAAALAFALLVASAGATAGETHGVLPFVEDDYAKALQQARARQVPLFIEAWAPW